MPKKRILIVGGSTRAAAWSAVRAGWQPICADLFADLDTRQIAEVPPVRDFPESLPEDTDRVRADGWFYTGGLENRPDLVERLERNSDRFGPLLGTSPAALRKVRDPFWLADIIRQAGAAPLELLPMSAPPPRDRSWMRKPLASAGGRAVAIWDRFSAPLDDAEPCYFQARIAGVTHAAIYRCRAGLVQFLGLTRQLSDTLSKAPGPFLYCGSVGPLPESETMRYRHQLDRIAECLVTRCRLQGIFGIDFIPDSQERMRILEVNPRYTASVEIVELAQEQALLLDLPARDIRSRRSDSCVAKTILYATKPLTAPLLDAYLPTQSEWEIPTVADVPVPGTRIEAGWPVCSVMAFGDTAEVCLRSLEEKAERVWRQLANCAIP